MKRSWLVSLIVLLVLAVGSYLAFLALQPSPLPAGMVYGNGHIEGVEVRLASEVPGRVIEHGLVEGETVSAGQRLVVIDPQSYRDELDAVRGELAALHGNLDAIESQIETWIHHTETAQRQAERVRRLIETQAASAQDLDLALDAEREAQGRLRNLRAERESLVARIESAESRVRIAETQVRRSEVLAPQDATVLVRAVETGEVVQGGQPLALLVDMDRLELKVYLSATDAGKVRQGIPARVRVDGFPERLFEGRVSRIDAFAQFTPRDIHLPEERTRMV
ncbi:MAG: HlyD family secretion protein, partial [Wenzhouxiangella sp.]